MSWFIKSFLGRSKTYQFVAADFKPLYKAPEIEVKTLEEEEIVVFKRYLIYLYSSLPYHSFFVCRRAKLFIFVKSDNYGGEVRTSNEQSCQMKCIAFMIVYV